MSTRPVYAPDIPPVAKGVPWSCTKQATFVLRTMGFEFLRNPLTHSILRIAHGKTSVEIIDVFRS